MLWGRVTHGQTGEAVVGHGGWVARRGLQGYAASAHMTEPHEDSIFVLKVLTHLNRDSSQLRMRYCGLRWTGRMGCPPPPPFPACLLPDKGCERTRDKGCPHSPIDRSPGRSPPDRRGAPLRKAACAAVTLSTSGTQNLETYKKNWTKCKMKQVEKMRGDGTYERSPRDDRLAERAQGQ